MPVICTVLASVENTKTSSATGVIATKSWSLGVRLKEPPSGGCCLDVAQ
jgi:hypothetical protein